MPNFLLAFALIFAAVLEDILPAFTACVARAFALAAWLLSGMGYFLDPGNPNTELANLFLAAAFNFAISSSS